MEYEMEREHVMNVQNNNMNYEVERASEKEILYAQEFYLREFSNKDQILRVYIDDENKKYYIDVFAAYALRMISYESTCKEYDRGMHLFEISERVLEMLRNVFKDKIKYIHLDRNKDKNTINNYSNEFDNNNNNNIKDAFDNMFNEIPKEYTDNNDNFQK